MSWVMAGVAIVGGGIKMYQGMKQKEAGELAEDALNKPEFQIPPEIAKNMSLAEKREYEGLPEEQKRAFLENQQRISQAALRSSSDRRGGLGVISQINANENLSNRQLLLDDTAARIHNQQRAVDARSVMAQYKMKRFEHQYNEYSSDLDYARAQQGAGLQNQQAGMNTMISGTMSGVGGHLQRQNNLDIAAAGGSVNTTNNSSSSGFLSRLDGSGTNPYSLSNNTSPFSSNTSPFRFQTTNSSRFGLQFNPNSGKFE